MRKKISKSVVDSFMDWFPVFKKVMSRKENGDVFEEHVELHEDEKLDQFKVGTSPDAFADAVERLPDVSLVERFDAVARLDAAIAQIQYSSSKPVEDEKK